MKAAEKIQECETLFFELKKLSESESPKNISLLTYH